MKNRKKILTSTMDEDFVLIDIKTTGLRPEKDRIIEINLISFKKGIINAKEHYSIDPKKKHSYISFDQVAEKLHKLIKNKIIFAYNAYFTYGFLKNEMLRKGIILEEKLLCSISLSRYIYPESKDHHLEAINHRLSIEAKGQDRLQLLMNFFTKLKDIMTPDDLKTAVTRLIQSQQPVFSLDHKENIPDTPGIYRCYDDNNVPIYIGKSVSIRDSLYSHFQFNNDLITESPIRKQIKKIDWIKTYGELGTSLVAANAIKKHNPIFNLLKEKNSDLFTFQLVKNGCYFALKIMRFSDIFSDEFVETYGVFKSKKDAEKLLSFFINQSMLCHQVNNLTRTKSACFRFKINKCYGACNKIESSKIYNSRVHKILKTFVQNQWPFKNKIAIKETCEKTQLSHFHVFHNWSYVDTIKSHKKLSQLKSKNHLIDINNYKLIKNYLNEEKNHSNIVVIE